MPALPELGCVFGKTRQIKIAGQMDAEHFCRADGQIGIAEKIKIDLHGIGQHAPEHRQAVKRCGYCKHLLHKSRKSVRQNGLFEQAQAENLHAFGYIARADDRQPFGLGKEIGRLLDGPELSRGRNERYKSTSPSGRAFSLTRCTSAR